MVRVRCYYVRGIGGMADRPASEVIEADSKTEARKKFEKRHPHAHIIQVNERDC